MSEYRRRLRAVKALIRAARRLTALFGTYSEWVEEHAEYTGSTPSAGQWGGAGFPVVVGGETK